MNVYDSWMSGHVVNQKYYISTCRRPKHIKLDKMFTYRKRLLPNLWSLNLAGGWLRQGVSACKCLSHHWLLVLLEMRNFIYLKCDSSCKEHVTRWLTFLTLNSLQSIWDKFTKLSKVEFLWKDSSVL